jgi:hypothetical protein
VSANHHASEIPHRRSRPCTRHTTARRSHPRSRFTQRGADSAADRHQRSLLLPVDRQDGRKPASKTGTSHRRKDGQATAFATSRVEKRHEHFGTIASALFFFGEVTFQ